MLFILFPILLLLYFSRENIGKNNYESAEYSKYDRKRDVTCHYIAKHRKRSNKRGNASQNEHPRQNNNACIRDTFFMVFQKPEKLCNSIFNQISFSHFTSIPSLCRAKFLPSLSPIPSEKSYHAHYTSRTKHHTASVEASCF
jgi:hypothetical protein